MKRVILGTGPVGMSLMEAEIARGNPVLLVNRKGFVREELPDGVQIAGLDAADPQALGEVLDGADIVYHAMGLPAAEQAEGLPRLMQSVVQAVIQQNNTLVYVDTLHAYGDAGGVPISESTPERAGFPLAELRKSLARTLQDAHYSRKLKMVIARSAEAYGPRVLEGSLGRSVFTPLLDHKAATVPGDLDLPHSYAYIRDLARNTATLAESPEAWGKVWHLPCSSPITRQQIFDILRDMLSRNVDVNTFTGKTGLFGWFNDVPPVWRDLMYQFNKPFVSNHTRFATTFGERCTAFPQGLWETLEWYRRNGLGA